MTLIRLQNIHKSYRDGHDNKNHVLKGVNMSVDCGEFVSIKGPSGSGKTTLLSILGTLLPPDSGEYYLNNKEMFSPEVDHNVVRNRHIGFVFQDHRLMPQLTALENILLPMLAYNSTNTAEGYEYARHLMKMTSIEGIGNQYPHTLSGGEASRVAVCRALIMKPLLLLADEPTGQLDAENARNIAHLLKDINSRLQTTIIMVTHSEETSAVADKILSFKDGVLV